MKPFSGDWIPVSRWLITMVSKSPKDRVVPLPNGLLKAYKWQLLTTYKSWDDPPSRMGSTIKSHQQKSSIQSIVILLMDKILHHEGWWLSHYLKGFNHPKWCRISSINSHTWLRYTLKLNSLPLKKNMGLEDEKKRDPKGWWYRVTKFTWESLHEWVV